MGATRTAATVDAARAFMEDPISFFDYSITKAHTIPPEELHALQREAMRIRFEDHRRDIEMVARVAEREGVTKVDDLDDMSPLLFAHSVYKSYPPALLDRKRFDLLTQWLDKLTTHDLSGIDASDCADIDAWLDLLDDQTPLRAITSSGTTGTLSIIPTDKWGGEYTMKLWRVTFFQTFGREPTPEELDPDVDVIWPTFADGKLGHLRMGPLLADHFTGGNRSRFHPLYDQAVSADLMYLAAKLRAAASRGELDRLELDPALLAKRDELIEMYQRQPEEMREFFEKMTTELRGKRIFVMGAYSTLHEVATAGLEGGVQGVFAPDSIIMTGGGAKGVVLPDDWKETVKRFFGVDRLIMTYGYSESGAIHTMCSAGRYHLQPWTIPYLLDPDTNEPLPRTGVQTGRMGFYNVSLRTYWGGTISGDAVEIDWGATCPCGATTPHLADTIERYSEQRGGDDKITCAAADEAREEAVNFIKEYEL